MKLKIPKLSDRKLNRVEVCVHFEAAEHPKVQKAIKDSVATAKLPGGLIGRRMLDRSDTHCHYHIDIAVPHLVPWDATSDDADAVLTPPSVVESGTFKATVWGSAIIKRDRLPKNGIIVALLDVSTKAGKYRLNLSGGTVAVTGGDIRQIHWYELDDDLIEINLALLKNVDIVSSLLVGAAEETAAAIEAVVLNGKAL